MQERQLSYFVMHLSSLVLKSQRKGENRRDSRGDEREGQGRKWNRNESEETEKTRNVSV